MSQICPADTSPEAFATASSLVGPARLKAVDGGPLLGLAGRDADFNKGFGAKNASGTVENKFAERLVGGHRHGGPSAMIDNSHRVILSFAETF